MVFPMENRDEYYMRCALMQARKAAENEEVPVGAILVYQDQIIARAHNQVELLKDATAHAEMLCLTMGSEYLGNWRLNDVTLYITLEPCIMCAGAIMQTRVKRVVWGAKDIRLGANGSFVDLFKEKHPMHQVEIVGGVLEDESAFLLREFFQNQRKKDGQCTKKPS